MISILQYASKQIEITTYITRRPKRASQGGQTSAGIDMHALNKLIRGRR